MPKLIKWTAEIVGAIVLTFVVAMLLVMLWFTLIDKTRYSHNIKMAWEHNETRSPGL